MPSSAAVGLTPAAIADQMVLITGKESSEDAKKQRDEVLDNALVALIAYYSAYNAASLLQIPAEYPSGLTPAMRNIRRRRNNRQAQPPLKVPATVRAAPYPLV